MRRVWNAKYSPCIGVPVSPSYKTKQIFAVSFSLMDNVVQKNWGSFGKIGSIQASTKRSGLRRK